MQDNAQILGFTAGELSPWLATRYDLQAYQRGAARLENFLVQPYGGLKRRVGTRYVTSAFKQNTTAVRLVPFNFSESDMLMLEFTTKGVRVLRDGKVLQKNGEDYVIDTPWTTDAMINSLTWMQVNDVMYMMTPDHATVLVMRHDDTNWSIEALVPNPYPRETYLTQSVGLSVIINPSSGLATLTFDSGEYFTSNMPGSEFLIADAPVGTTTLFMNEGMTISSYALPDLSKSAALEGRVYHEYNSATGMNEYYTCTRTYTASSYNGSKKAKDYPHYFLPGAMRLNSDNMPYEVSGEWEVRTNGTWDGLWELWRTYDGMAVNEFPYSWNWTCIKSFGQDEFNERKNWALTGSEDIPCRMVLVCRANKGNTVGPIMYFRSMSTEREYRYLISSVTSPTTAIGRSMHKYCEKDPSFYTKQWSFGAFGARNGFPRFAGMHQGRLWLGGTSGQPTTLFASSVGDYKNFRVGSAEDCSLHLTLATDDQSRICWICPMRNLLVGTSESEWTLSAPDGGSITATNASFSRQSAVGSDNKVAYGVENTVFYVQRGGKRLREISYKLEADGYTSTDASILAEHLFEAGVKEWVVQRGNCFHLWVMMNDGSIAVLTTNPEQQVAAWQRVSFGGRKVLGMASLAREGNSEDEVWFVIQNPTSGHTSLERILDDNECIDGYVEVKPASGTNVDVGVHLAGMQVLVYPKGKPEQAQRTTVSAKGLINIPNFVAGTSYYVGAEYESVVETMPFEREHSFNTVQQLGRVKLRLHESSPAFSYKGQHATRWELYDPARDHLPTLYTGAVRISQIPSPGVGQGFCLRADGAMEFALVSLTIEVDFHGR